MDDRQVALVIDPGHHCPIFADRCFGFLRKDALDPPTFCFDAVDGIVGEPTNANRACLYSGLFT